MHHFAYRDGVLHCEDVSLEAVARELGTPAYVIRTQRCAATTRS